MLTLFHLSWIRAGLFVWAALPFWAFAQIGIDTLGVRGAKAENFNTLSSSGLSNGWTDDSTLTGWYANQSGYIAGHGTQFSGSLYSFGSQSSGDRALGAIASGSNSTVCFGVRVKNNTGVEVNRVLIRFTGEQWRVSQATHSNTLYLEYRQDTGFSGLMSGGWTALSKLNFVSPDSSGSVSALNGNDSINRFSMAALIPVIIPDGEEFHLRWTDTDDPVQDHGLAIDDFEISLYQETGVLPDIADVGLIYLAADMTLSGDLRVDRTLEIASGVVLTIDSFTLSLSGNIGGNGTIRSNGRGSILVQGSGNAGTLYLDQSSPDTSNRLMDFTLALSDSGILALGNELQIRGIVNLSEGELISNGNLRLVALQPGEYGQISGAGTGTVSGAVSMQMIVPGTNAGWRNFSVPFDTVSFGQLGTQTAIYLADQINPARGKNVFTWSESSKNWSAVTSDGSMYGQAFNLFLFDPSNTVMELSGTYVASDLNLGALSFTSSGNAQNDGWHLIPNPYPSALDWNALAQPGGIAGNYAVWSVEDGAYLSWNGTTGGAGQYIPPMHAFWVKVNSTVSSYVISNSARVTEQHNHFHKKVQAENHLILITSSDQHRYSDRLDLYTDDMNPAEVVHAPKLDGLPETPTLWVVEGGARYAIYSGASFDLFQRPIPLGFRCSESGQYRIKPVLEHFGPGIHVMLEDRIAGKFHDLTQGAYSFSYSNTELEQGRFFVHYRSDPAQSRTGSVMEEGPYVFEQDGLLLVSIPFECSGDERIEVWDLTGRCLQILPAQQGLNALAPQLPGVYVVRVWNGKSCRSVKALLIGAG